MFQVFLVVLSYSSQKVASEVNKTTDIIYKILYDLLPRFKVTGGNEIKEDLFLFVERVQNFHFTAGGLFPLDMTTLFMISGSIATYIMILPIK